MKIFRSIALSGRPYPIDETETAWKKSEFAKTYPLLDIKSASLKGTFLKKGSYLVFEGAVEGNLILADARTNAPFEYPVSENGVFELLEDDDAESDYGFYFPENEIDTHEFLRAVLYSLVPIKPLAEGSALPEGVRFDDEPKAGDENSPSPFDALKDLDFEN